MPGWMGRGDKNDREAVFSIIFFDIFFVSAD